MNDWNNDYLAEFHRQDLLRETEQICLANLAMQSRVYRPSLFTRAMHGFASWMILAGKKLHNRYEIPTAHTHQTTSSSFAR
ncbi:MAG TPA: hypothetical protein VIS72_08145 [Anaerolineales bacterium]